jgi:hypothetical protein
MTRAKRIRTLVLAVGGVLILAVVGVAGVVGYNMQHTAAPAHASGVGGGGPCVVQTGGAPVCHFKGFTADANYSSVDRSTCSNGIYTYFAVQVFDGVQINPSSSTTGDPLVYVYFSQYNNCTYSNNWYYGETTTADIKTTGNLGSATVKATVPLADWNQNPGPTVTVDVAWTGFGDTSSVMDVQSRRDGGLMTISRFTASNRMAVVSGTISDGTTAYTIATTSVIKDVQSGTVQIEHA